MTLEQLRMFVTVADLGSIARAAEHLHKTQPAISIAIKRLQDEFNLSLLQKSGNRLQLTQDGIRMLPHCRYLLRKQSDLTGLAEHLSRDHERKVELVYDTICQQLPIYDAVINTQRAYPHTELYLSSVARLGALQRVVDGDADVAITPWMHNFHELATFETLPFGQFEVVAVMHVNCLRNLNGEPDHSSHLHDIPLLMPQAFDIDINIEKMMGVVPAFTIRSNDSDTQKALLMKGAGWGYIPRDKVADELASGELFALKLSDVTCSIRGEISAVRKLGQQSGPVSDFLWEQLRLQTESQGDMR